MIVRPLSIDPEAREGRRSTGRILLIPKFLNSQFLNLTDVILFDKIAKNDINDQFATDELIRCFVFGISCLGLPMTV